MSKINIDRLESIAFLVAQGVEVRGRLFDSYTDMLDWCATLLGCDPETVKKTLKRAGIWVPGRRGRRGGHGLYELQRRLLMLNAILKENGVAGDE